MSRQKSVSQLNDQRIDQLSMDAPILPTHRPPTKRECWDRYHFIYADIKPHDELVRFAREAWVWFYVYAYNFKGWRKHPDWVDRENVIHEAVPDKPFPPDLGFCIREVVRLHEIATRCTRVAA